MCYITHFPIKNIFHELVLYFIFLILHDAWEWQPCYPLHFSSLNRFEKGLPCYLMQVESFSSKSHLNFPILFLLYTSSSLNWTYLQKVIKLIPIKSKLGHL
jgi:hypothetical protein